MTHPLDLATQRFPALDQARRTEFETLFYGWTYQQELQRASENHSNWYTTLVRRASTFFSGSSAAGLGFVACSAVFFLFPQLGIVAAIIIGLASAGAELMVYRSNITESNSKRLIIGTRRTVISNVLAKEKLNRASRRWEALADARKQALWKKAFLSVPLSPAHIHMIEQNAELLKQLQLTDAQRSILAFGIYEKFLLSDAQKKILFDHADFSQFTFDPSTDEKAIKTLQALAVFYNAFAQDEIDALLADPQIKKRIERRVKLQKANKVFSVMNGVGFGLITFTHFCAAIMQLFFSTITVSLLATPLWVFILGGILALFAGIGYGMMMNRLLDKCINDNVLSLLKNFFREHFTFKHIRAAETKQEKANEAAKLLVKFLLFASILGIIFISNVTVSGAWINAGIETFLLWTSHATKALEVAASVISYTTICAFVLPVGFLFDIENCLETLRELFKVTWNKFTSTLKHAGKKILSNPLYLFGAPIRIAGLFIHVASEGAVSAEPIKKGIGGMSVQTTKILVASMNALDEAFVDGHYGKENIDPDTVTVAKDSQSDPSNTLATKMHINFYKGKQRTLRFFKHQPSTVDSSATQKGHRVKPDLSANDQTNLAAQTSAQSLQFQ